MIQHGETSSRNRRIGGDPKVSGKGSKQRPRSKERERILRNKEEKKQQERRVVLISITTNTKDDEDCGDDEVNNNLGDTIENERVKRIERIWSSKEYG